MLTADNPDMYFDEHIAEIYDRVENGKDDAALLGRLIGRAAPLVIFEPFCGTGRILIPLACDGHTLTGWDHSAAMLARAQMKIAALPSEVRRRVTLCRQEVLQSSWPAACDLVVLGGNCFYELSSAPEQNLCLARAFDCLRPGGHVFVDNDHMEGELAESWRTPGKHKARFPTSTCQDGAVVERITETIGFDGPARIWRARHVITITTLDGRKISRELFQQKHPVSMEEVKNGLESQGFVIEHVLGDRDGRPYTPESPRAIFWARKPT